MQNLYCLGRFSLVRLTLALNPNRLSKDKQHSELIGLHFTILECQHSSASLHLVCVNTNSSPLSTQSHIYSYKMSGSLLHTAPLKVIKIEGSGATAQGSTVIAAAEVPAHPHLTEGKSQFVTKNSNHTSYFYFGFGVKKC